MKILTQAEQWPWRVGAMDPSGVHVPIEVLKHYSTFNPYEPEGGIPNEEEHIKNRMGEYEKTLQSPEGWEGFGKGNTISYPVLSVGASGKHAVLNGHHRLWAADKLGMTHVPVEFILGEDDDWARKFGQPVEPHVANLLKRMT